ncbi:MAG: ATPase central domain protein [Thermomicrobiales bacterium]|nr:ATPase central domain protein [Thermomicrobiales bacterium]
MAATAALQWAETNQRDLVTALAALRQRLERHAGASADAAAPAGDGLPATPALDALTQAFGLSPFERAVLLLCAGIELDAGVAAACAAHGDQSRALATFNLAMAALPDPHWSALSPDGPLRRWRMVEVVAQPGTPLTASPLRIDERVLHYLVGVHHLDERLAGLVEPVPLTGQAGPLSPSQELVSRRIVEIWSRAGVPPLLALCGGDEPARREIAARACLAVGLNLCAIEAEAIPANPAELAELLRLWEREATLAGSALYLASETIETGGAATPLTRFLDRLAGPALVGATEPPRGLRQAMVTLDVRKPTAGEQRSLWHAALGSAGADLNGRLNRLVTQFDFGGAAILASTREALALGPDDEPLGERLWNASRAQARPRLDDLAQRIESVATWDDLVLPEPELALLREIVAHVAHRATVYEEWGFATASKRGLGIGVLFAGASGTGKTMAAEVLAGSLRLDLYRIDLSGVVSKYIGETEKNLRRVFDAAEEGGAILFFDEADALFGKRSEIKDSHDRYANIEINYLLQRMESYRGVAVLATNMKSALDPAFLRRIRFVVNFPFPDAMQRAEIWRRVFPPATPTEALDVDTLARLTVPGGSIRNIALNAAFLAASSGEPVRMRHLHRAARVEYAKLERPLPEAEIAGWD